MKQKIFNVIISIAVCCLWVIKFIDNTEVHNPSLITEDKKEVVIITPEFLTAELTDSLLLEALDYYEVQFPHIVYAQAILETGHFRSKVCKIYNNLFGLYNSRTKDYFKFNHWSESVLAYKEYVQRKHNSSECYYTFLEELPYATDSTYINKIKTIVKRNKNIAVK